ncbi:tRNA (adenosine(37)-N6)-threonylcarbamoyltransferase complex ATPase subunit type 1 TsaE [Hominiventricola aquisgranensis]|jgi:tRNA threonylcarbamoyladenosine biosynthesis protein TsaE|uniref:tRNA threonylcarbamoyladenosine biosynthesis protein TsaE n=1 Tax=Hominiventricola aquisgranensis TaxID=3133164 RepID=A0ABV1I5K1_9FIRM|nr:tRNA (adenosine(37)-N6)-threonylcarbamoyltransferase complex ATPase subunit type 1 TsaE [Clostridiaceae bacterium]MDY4545316.1 tRNA (adenosine(37)-N6)-threonylcarbamoyltransferase complex ATPase subunit type 1 TsaE [Candidatus Choladocola sp.]RHP48656.1 tRNA (adenosine(37)-N6)-threonylcarbamoyltransferase complex ATPase subunit type 1 TsaE [Clostridiaceae bacterium AF31-3BH]
MAVIDSFCAKDTYELGEKIGQMAKPGMVISLTGDLGVGKTVFTQGLAKGLGIEEPVNSPTFTIVQVYEEGRLPLYHFDVYRIGDIEEMDEIGYEDYFYGEGVCLIEWADLIREILPEQMCRVTIEKDLEKGFDYRKITLEGFKGIEEQEA